MKAKIFITVFGLLVFTSCTIAPIGSAEPTTTSLTSMPPTSIISDSSALISTLTATSQPTSKPTSTAVTLTPTPSCISVASPRATTTMELYGTIHSMGVIVSFSADDDPDQNALALVEYSTGGKDTRNGFPLSRISETRFVGSLFWLDPGKVYDVRVTLIDEGGLLNCVELKESASTRADIIIPEPNTKYYVSPDGSSTSCFLDSPCSLIQGLNLAKPGDAVILRGGDYYLGEIKIPRSGKEGAPIIIQGYPGEKAILDGADPATFTWTDMGDGIYSTIVNVPNVSLVLANGQRLYRYQSIEDLQNLRWEIPGFYAEGTKVSVHLAKDADPNTEEMIVGRRSYAFWVEQRYIFILNLTFRHYDQGMYRQALYMRNASDNVVQGSTFAINGIGIGFKGESHRNVIQDNEFYDTIYDWPWDAVKALKTDHGPGLETGGIRFFEPNRDQPQVTSRGTIIRRNVFHDFFDGLGTCAFYTSAHITNETDVYENYVYRVGDDGLETDGPCSNVRIWGNTFHDVIAGISLAPARIGPVYVIRNLIHHIGRSDGCPFGHVGLCGGTAFKFQFNNPGSGPMYLFHNTTDASSLSYTMWISEPTIWPILVSRNNNWGSPTSQALGNRADDPMDFDYDNVIASEQSNLLDWLGIIYYTLEEFSLATGQELHGISVNPQFTNPSEGDYSLLPDSPLIDAGQLIPGINDSYEGLAPDIGAFEYGLDDA